MSRTVRQLAFLLQVPAAIGFYLALLGRYRGEGPSLAVIAEAPTLAFLAIVLLWVAAEAFLLVSLVGEPPLFGEFSGLAYDPRRPLVAALALLPDLASCLDHAHLRWMPLAGGDATRWAGNLLLGGAFVLTLASDRRLRDHFREPGVLGARSLIESGPYRVIRHPRYAGVVLGKLATPLALGSGLGLLALVPVVVLLPRTIRGEEEHMLRTYGDRYRFYRARTRRLIPGVY